MENKKIKRRLRRTASKNQLSELPISVSVCGNFRQVYKHALFNVPAVFQFQQVSAETSDLKRALFNVSETQQAHKNLHQTKTKQQQKSYIKKAFLNITIML